MDKEVNYNKVILAMFLLAIAIVVISMFVDEEDEPNCLSPVLKRYEDASKN